jgi:double-stranded uracil-DNA glycosylase
VVPDLLRPGLALVVCGINPGLWSGWHGHHFAGPANRLWPALHRAGITPRRLAASDREELLDLGVGITNLVPRTTAVASELSTAELREGAERVRGLVAALRPGAVAVLGMGAYRTAFRDPRAPLGRQDGGLAGRPLWVLPNPSGLQQRYTVDEIAEGLAAAYREGRRGITADA